MLTKYYIEIDGVKAEMPRGCLKNWDEIKCVYKRSDFSGVTRSFTTQFEFVGEMYDKLMALYLRDGVNAKAVISLYTITNDWRWEEQFSCNLDFSSIKWDNYIVKLNCIDDSLAALIKANKSTKYEGVIDLDIKPNRTFAFNRLPIENNITYEYTGGSSNETDGSLITDSPANDRVYMGIVSDDDVSVNTLINWNEDQNDDADSYMLTAHGDVSVRLDIEIIADRCYPYTAPSLSGSDSEYFDTSCEVLIYRANGTIESKGTMHFGPDNLRFCGRYNTIDDLRSAYPHGSIYVNGSPKSNYWAIVDGIVWMVYYRGGEDLTDWDSTGQTEAEFGNKRQTMKVELSLSAGDKVAISTSGSKAKLYSSKFVFSWIGKGNPISVSAFSPQCLGQYILNKMCDGHTNAIIEISDFDPRLAKTAIVAAESIRCIPKAKIYTSFNDFVDWMETVFGYTYYLDGSRKSKFHKCLDAFGGYSHTAYPISSEPWQANNSEIPTKDDIVYFSPYGKFIAFDGNAWYSVFPGDTDYNDPDTGHARTDTIFRIRRNVNGSYTSQYYYFANNADGTFNSEPVVYEGNVTDLDKPFQGVVFVHRSELFNPQAPIHKLSNVRDVEYSVESSNIYSSVNIGYDKKDYQSINGRDEFNFNNTYSTGCTVSDKKLTMKSKYRADCYGIEFAAQKRGEDTTDSTSDNDVFFIYCKANESGVLVPDTTAVIENAISEDVFNGAFSPMACVDANAGYIGMQSSSLTLEFASSDGNSNIIIDERPMSSDIVISDPLMTCGTLDFSCVDVDDKIALNDIIEVHSNGITYRGFLKEVSFKYAKAETVKYKLIVKEVEL